ncbi:MAG: hypothetical protein KGJ59_11425 [Bacteroidota bacterium]|nr:hypothetical protein [Bacteroidota bacterium]
MNTFVYKKHRCIQPYFGLIAAILLFAYETRAQLTAPRYDERLLFRGMTGITFGGAQQEWNLSGFGNVLQQSGPVRLAVPLSNRILITVENSPAMTKLGTLTVQGIADTRASFSYVVPGDKLWINGGVSMPTGITELTHSQYEIATIVAQPAFNYYVPVFGQGLNGNVGFAYAYSYTRRFIIGLGASYLYKGEYVPVVIEGATEKLNYDPGDEISANAGFDYSTFSRNQRFSADMTVTNYLPDKVNNVKSFQSGMRYMLFLVYSIKDGATSHMFQLRSRIHSRNQIFSNGASTTFKSSQQVEATYRFSWLLGNWFSVGIPLEWKQYTGDQIPLGGSIIETGTAGVGSAGVDAGILFSQSASLSLTAKYGEGSVTINSTRYTVKGTEIGGGVRIQF